MNNKRTQKQIKRSLRYYANKYVGIAFRAVYIDNEFAGILPEDPRTGKVSTYHPSLLMRYRKW